MAGSAGVLRQLLAVFSFEVDSRGLDKGKEKLRDWVGDMKKVAAAFAGGAIAKGIGHFVKDTVDEMMNIRKGAQELKITTDEMQQLQSAARATGMDVKWLHFTLERLEVNVERAGHGAARQAEAMRLLGINAKHANGSVKSAKELFLDFASGMEKVTNQNTQARAVWDLMGRGAHRLLPLLRMGRARVEELMQATEEYGKYQKEEIEQAAKYAITLERLRLVWMSIKGFIMGQWLPVLEKQTDKMIKAGKWMLAMAKNSLIAKAALYVLQAAMAGLALKMAFAFPYATALMGAIVLLVGALDDLMVWWAGGESIIGAILDKIGGKGTSAQTIEMLKQSWEGLIEMTKAFGAWIKDHPEVFAGLEMMMKLQGMAFKAYALPWKALGTAGGWVAGKYVEHKAAELEVPSQSERNMARMDAARRGAPIPGSREYNQMFGAPTFTGPPQMPNSTLGYGRREMEAHSGSADRYVFHTNVSFTGTVIDKAAVDHAMSAASKAERQAAAANLRREKQASGE